MELAPNMSPERCRRMEWGSGMRSSRCVGTGAAFLLFPHSRIF